MRRCHNDKSATRFRYRQWSVVRQLSTFIVPCHIKRILSLGSLLQDVSVIELSFYFEHIVYLQRSRAFENQLFFSLCLWVDKDRYFGFGIKITERRVDTCSDKECLGVRFTFILATHERTENTFERDHKKIFNFMKSIKFVSFNKLQ